MKNFTPQFLDALSESAERSRKGRCHSNIHKSYTESCQRLFNAIEVDSYIRPHRHALSATNECLIAIRGVMTLVVFDDGGDVIDFVRFGAQSLSDSTGVSAGVEIPPEAWHTVIANEPGSILFELKEGPFDPESAKEYAGWAPEEETDEGQRFLGFLKSTIERCP